MHLPYEKGIQQLLKSPLDIQKRVEQLGQKITEDYRHISSPVVIVVLMKGAAIFSSDLVRHIKLPTVLDYMIASSYGQGTKSSGEVRIIKDLQESIFNKHVIVVDDIIDTGHTFKKIIELLNVRSPASIKTCTLLDKSARREQPISADYVGFEIPNSFVVGYGLDFNQQYRNLPYIGILDPECISDD